MVERFDWTNKRIATLKAEYPEKGADYFAKQWGMTRAAVAARANRLGLKYVGLWGNGRRAAPKPEPTGARAQMRRQQVAKIVRQQEAHVGKRGASLEIVETVSARVAPKSRRCAWRETDHAGLRHACCAHAVPGQMWCEDHLQAVAAIRRVG